MNPSEHLTRNQIAAFSAGSLAASESRSIGGHLIRCVECRSLLPLPNPVQVWTAIATERQIGGTEKRDNSPSSDSTYSQWFVGLFRTRNRLAWAGGMLLVAFSLAGLLIMSGSNGGNAENEVARTFELENPIKAPNSDQTDETNNRFPASSGNDSGTKEVNSVSTDREGVEARKTNSRPTGTDSRKSSGIGRNISPTRGSTTPCAVGRTIEVELGSQKSDLILRWKRVRNAAKYHLYVSDDNEILIDEFETDQDTSYILKKPLDPSKAYKWKIVITLENGEKLYADAQKFTAKDFQSSFNTYRGKARTNTRCLAN
ncbi:MAG: hypothetical protein UZ17_ACD001002857 [Acidobacteria bacterium OLB17]|nr:MAG: hypothetical protein UZ17_ACD001002857 [Acidobacteria bacterium OLB17]